MIHNYCRITNTNYHWCYKNRKILFIKIVVCYLRETEYLDFEIDFEQCQYILNAVTQLNAVAILDAMQKVEPIKIERNV